MRGTPRYRAHVRAVVVAVALPVLAVAAVSIGLVAANAARLGDPAASEAMGWVLTLQVALGIAALVFIVAERRVRVSAWFALAVVLVLNPYTLAVVFWLIGFS